MIGRVSCWVVMCMYESSAAPLKPIDLNKERQSLSPLGQPTVRSSDEEPSCAADNFIKTFSVASVQPVDRSCRQAFSPVEGSRAQKTVPIRKSAHFQHTHHYHHHPLSAGQIPNPAPIYLSADPNTNWILEVSALCSWMSRIRRANLDTLDSFKRCHQST